MLVSLLNNFFGGLREFMFFFLIRLRFESSFVIIALEGYLKEKRKRKKLKFKIDLLNFNFYHVGLLNFCFIISIL